MNSAHTSTAGFFTSALCQHQQCPVAKALRCGRERSRRSFKRHSPCFASSTNPPETCVELPEPLPRIPFCEIRKQLEQLYQLEHPQHTHTPRCSPSVLPGVATRSLSVEQTASLPVQLREPPPEASKLQDPDSKHQREDYYANVGDAIRTLREETPILFQRDLSCKYTVHVLPPMHLQSHAATLSCCQSWHEYSAVPMQMISTGMT